MQGVIEGLIAAALIGIAARLVYAPRCSKPLIITMDQVVSAGRAVMPDGRPTDRPAARAGTRGVYDWVHSRGALDHRDSEIRCLVRNRSKRNVLVVDLRVRFLERGDAVYGTLIHHPNAGGNDAIVLLLDLELSPRLFGQPRISEWVL
jgi:hypothetical protein